MLWLTKFEISQAKYSSLWNFIGIEIELKAEPKKKLPVGISQEF